MRFYTPRNIHAGAVALDVRHLTRFGFFHDVSFQLHEGEILGVIGLCGAGRSELARSLCGLDPVHYGEVMLFDEELPPEKLSGCSTEGAGVSDRGS